MPFPTVSEGDGAFAPVPPISGDGSSAFPPVGGAPNTVSILPGTVQYIMTDTPPDNYLAANGALVSRTTYVDLFAVVGEIYGAGDGSTTFALPDYSGQFLRFLDPDSVIDTTGTRTARPDGTSGQVVGTPQVDDNKSHNHDVLRGTNTSIAHIASASASTTRTTGSSGSSESRPRNINLLACIRYAS